MIAVYLIGNVFLLGSCMSDRPSVHRKDLIGTYQAKADTWISRPSHEVGERLNLRADGTYELSKPSRNAGTSAKVGHWIFADGSAPEVELDHSGYPIRFDGNTVRLIIDDDINARYEKLK